MKKWFPDKRNTLTSKRQYSSLPTRTWQGTHTAAAQDGLEVSLSYSVILKTWVSLCSVCTLPLAVSLTHIHVHIHIYTNTSPYGIMHPHLTQTGLGSGLSDSEGVCSASH